MGMLCAIFHSRFRELTRIIPSVRKAQLVDYILLGWQSSNYRLKNSNKKWFMKPYAEIVSDTGIPKSTLERYIKELADEGFIVRRQALYNRRNEDEVYQVKKGTYIHISDKLLILLQQPKASVDKLDNTSEEITHSPQKVSLMPIISVEKSKPSDTELSNNEGTDSLKMRGSIIRDLYTSVSNTISVKKLLQSVDKDQSTRLIRQFESMQALFSTTLQEELPDNFKQLALGTLFNLCFEHQVIFSNPKQVAAEYVYALANQDFYLPHIRDLKHRNNILAKLIRKKSWMTPKGFYKYSYLSAEFPKPEVRQQKLQQEKLARALSEVSCPKERGNIEARFELAAREEAKFTIANNPKRAEMVSPKVKALKARLKEINADIGYQGRFLTELEQQNLQDGFHIDTIQSVKISLDALYKEQLVVERELEILIGEDFALCA